MDCVTENFGCDGGNVKGLWGLDVDCENEILLDINIVNARIDESGKLFS